MSTSSINSDEIDKFDNIADEWWDLNGKFKALHILNPTRLNFIKSKIDELVGMPSDKIDVLDIGCGGGLIAEPLSKIGYNVTAIDASSKAIEIAKNHANIGGLNINYQCSSAESLAQEGKKFDVVLALEIIEHVDNLELFLESCASLVKDSGIIIIATINKTLKSYFQAILAAEYILRWVPFGTHEWQKFVAPSLIINKLLAFNFQPNQLVGIEYDILKAKWKTSTKYDVNYILVMKKKLETTFKHP